MRGTRTEGEKRAGSILLFIAIAVSGFSEGKMDPNMPLDVV